MLHAFGAVHLPALRRWNGKSNVQKLPARDMKLLYPDHITIPCSDLRVAEEFYVGVLGADLMMRINRRLLERMGWADEDIEANRAVHLSLTLGAGPRLDLFQYPEGEPRPNVVMHPHIALMTRPGKFLSWKRRLEAEGVRTTEIRRPGPPGQASFFFNDPLATTRNSSRWASSRMT